MIGEQTPKERLAEDLYRVECELELLAAKAPYNVLALCRRILQMAILRQANREAAE